jgi:urease accessory protein
MTPSLLRSPARAALAALLAGWLAPAAAHHPTGGATPATLLQGVLSGIGHPMIGLDHLSFLLAAGLLAAWVLAVPARRAVGLAAAFALAGTLGTLLRVPDPALPWAEALVGVSVLAVGACLLLRAAPGAASAVVASVLAGLVHGHAFGEAVVGAESTHIAGYLAGLLVTQSAILVAAYLGGRWLLRTAPGRVPASMRTVGLAASAMGVLGILRAFAG